MKVTARNFQKVCRLDDPSNEVGMMSWLILLCNDLVGNERNVKPVRK